MLIDPISLGIAGVSTGLGLFQASAEAKARQQDYLNQAAFQSASSKFNQWQAAFNAKNRNLDAQYGYWVQTLDYNQQRAYTSQLRSYDLAQEIKQAEVVNQTRVSAGLNYVMGAEALSQRFAEEGMQQAVAMQQAQYRMLQNSSAFQAGMQEGASSDRLVNDFARQMGDMQTLTNINQKLSERQYKRDQLGRVVNYLNEYRSQDFFEVQERWDPIAPWAPLPSLVQPPPPSMIGARPGGLSALNVGTQLLGGVSTYINTAQQIKQLAEK